MFGGYTYFEFFLVVFLSSFIIFSLALRKESSKKIIDFIQDLNSVKVHIYDLIGKVGIKLTKKEKENLDDRFENFGRLFKKCLKKVNAYVYHTFYAVFFFSSIGIGLTFFLDLNLFQLTLVDSYTPSLIPIVYWLSTITFYFYIRSAFVLILFTKIDTEYLEKITKKYDDRLNYKNLLEIGTKKKEEKQKEEDNSSLTKIYLLKLLFPLFFVWNKEFKAFFYEFYSL